MTTTDHNDVGRQGAIRWIALGGAKIVTVLPTSTYYQITFSLQLPLQCSRTISIVFVAGTEYLESTGSS